MNWSQCGYVQSVGIRRRSRREEMKKQEKSYLYFFSSTATLSLVSMRNEINPYVSRKRER